MKFFKTWKDFFANIVQYKTSFKAIILLAVVCFKIKVAYENVLVFYALVLILCIFSNKHVDILNRIKLKLLVTTTTSEFLRDRKSVV